MAQFVYLDSLLAHTSLNQNLALLDFGNVIVQKNFRENKNVHIITCVNFISKAIYVGKGLLTASIYGEHCTTPTSRLILRTIRELSYNHFGGIIIILPNNSPALFNTGVAVERAKNDCLHVKLCIVEDKYKEVPISISFFTKVAGAMSLCEKSLDDIYSYCDLINKNTINVFINRENIDFINASTDMKYIANEFLNRLKLELTTSNDEKSSIIVLLTLSTTEFSSEDLLTLVNIILKQFISSNYDIKRFYIDRTIIESELRGLKLTILKKFDEQLLKYLDMPCDSLIWDQIHQKESLKIENTISSILQRKTRLAPPVKGPKLDEFQTRTLELSVEFACNALISCEKQINLIDKERSNGNLGTRFKYACEKLKQRISANKMYTEYPHTFLELLSKLMENSLGSTIGSIYGILFEAASNSFANYDENVTVTPEMWLKSLKDSANALQFYTKTKFGEQTIYDPIWGCIEVVQNELESGTKFLNAFENGVSAAQQIASNTRFDHMKHPDSGAHSVGIWMRAVQEGVKLKCI